MSKNSIFNLDIFKGKEKLEKAEINLPSSVKEVKKAKEVKADEYVLVTLDACWADEFDVYHSWVMTQEDYDEGVKDSKESIGDRRDFEIYFGTNEALQIDGFNDYISNLSVRSITEEQYKALNSTLGGSFGMFDYYFPYGY